MHELSIAQNLIELVSEHASQEGACRVRTIRIRLGELSGFQRALYFCFERVAQNTVCEGARLEIETVPLTLHCGTCNDTRRPSTRYSFRCCECGMPASEVVTGREMQITAIEFGFAGTDVPAPDLSSKHERLTAARQIN